MKGCQSVVILRSRANLLNMLCLTIMRSTFLLDFGISGTQIFEKLLTFQKNILKKEEKGNTT